jgi:hypothetical protein
MHAIPKLVSPMYHIPFRWNPAHMVLLPLPLLLLRMQIMNSTLFKRRKPTLSSPGIIKLLLPRPHIGLTLTTPLARLGTLCLQHPIWVRCCHHHTFLPLPSVTSIRVQNVLSLTTMCSRKIISGITSEGCHFPLCLLKPGPPIHGYAPSY